ncbi:MFS transporter [Bacillaceae bacterium SAOS 7]|nr:MFS transporter [Bacillaceae bacterium SAOS 7]
MSADQSSLLKNPFVRAILASALFLQVGIWIRNFAVLLFIMEQTKGDPFAVSMISVAEFAPIFLFSFIGGTFADRWRPKRTMIWCDILSALSVFAVLLALMVSTWKLVFLAMLISSILSQFSQPSGMKLFKLHLTESLVQAAMSIYQTIFAVFMILGPALGTVIYQNFGIYTSIGFTGVAFLLSALMLAFIPKDQTVDKEKANTTLLQEMKSGFQYVWERKVLKLLGTCFIAAGLGIGLIQPLNIFLVTEQLGLEKENLQWLLMVNGSGMIAGRALAMMFSQKILPQRMLILGMFMNAIGISVIGLSTNLWLTLVAEFISGLFMPCIQIGINTMILKNTEGSFIGRVNGILMPLFTGSMVVTMSIAGKLLTMFTIVSLYQAAALLFMIGLLFILPLYYMKNEMSAQPVQPKSMN